MRDLRGADVSILTLGQYLRPSAAAPAGGALLPPDEFARAGGGRPRAGLRPRRVGPAGALLVSRQGARPTTPALVSDGLRPDLHGLRRRGGRGRRPARHPVAHRAQAAVAASSWSRSSAARIRSRCRRGASRSSSRPSPSSSSSSTSSCSSSGRGPRSTASSGWFGFVEMMVFLGILMLGFLYIWQKRGLEWE